MNLESLLAGGVVGAARGLLGRRLATREDGVETAVLLTEVEAYGGHDDPASHAFGGRTVRNASMFGPPGTLYVYRSYGVHWCANVVCGPPGEPSAVLLRGGRPLVGRDTMIKRRGREANLSDGPGKLCQALAVSGAMDGTSVFDGPVAIQGEPASGEIIFTPRIGISRAQERMWRFVLRG